MSLIEKEISKYKSLELITLSEFYKIWDFNKDTKIALVEDGETLPVYTGYAYKVPIIFAERRILRFSYPEEKTPIIFLQKFNEVKKDYEYSLWREWVKNEKLF